MNQESEQHEVDGMKKGVDSTGEVMLMYVLRPKFSSAKGLAKVKG